MKIISQILIGVLLVSIVGCKGSNDSKDGKNLTGGPDYLKESCDFGYSEGGGFASYADELKVTSFSKAYSRHHLKNIHNASAAQTYKYMIEHGQVRVFRSTDAASGCAMFASLAKPESDIQKFWDTTAGDTEKDGILLGVYLPKDYTLVPGHEATILVRNDTSRWTLVHEFMHHLFELESIKAGKSQGSVMTDLLKTSEDLKRKGKELENSTVTKFSEIKILIQETVDIMAKLLILFDDLVVGSALEEMTIESELMGDYSSFSYFPRKFDSSKSYIISNYEKGLELYDSMSDPIKAIDGLVSGAASEGVQINTGAYSAAKRLIDNRKSEMRTVYYNSLRVSSLVALNPASLLSIPSFSGESSVGVEHEAVCPHTQAVVDLLGNLF